MLAERQTDRQTEASSKLDAVVEDSHSSMSGHLICKQKVSGSNAGILSSNYSHLLGKTFAGEPGKLLLARVISTEQDDKKGTHGSSHIARAKGKWVETEHRSPAIGQLLAQPSSGPSSPRSQLPSG